MRNGQRELGDKLGPRLAAIMTEATIAARAKLSHHEAKVRQAATQALIDRAGHEVADLYRPIIHKAIDLHDGNMHPHLEDFFRQAASGVHQWQALSGLAMGQVSGSLGSVFSNGLAPIVYLINSSQPNLILDQNTTAAAVAAGLFSMAEGQADAAKNGYSAGAFETLYRLAQTPPAPGDLRDLVNRGEMTSDDADAWLRRQGYDESVRARILNLRLAEIDAPDIALAMLRGNITDADGYQLAHRVGISNSQLDLLVGNTGEPPSVTDLAIAYRRNIIDKARFERGIRQSRVRNEWIDVLEKVQYAPMSVADAVTAFVQGHLDQSQLNEVANVNGLEPQYVNVLTESAGEPISKTEVYELLRRKEISQAEATQAIRESRIKNKYIPAILKLVEQIPPAREVATLYSHGALTEVQAKDLISRNGYSTEVQDAFLASAIHGKTAALKNVSLAQVQRLYIEGLMSWAEGEALLKKSGYQPAELSYVKELLDNQRIYRSRETSISKIRSLYEAYHIDRNTASGQLDALQVSSTERDHLLAQWDLIRESNAKLLTKAEILDALKYEIIDQPTAQSMLEQIGYSQDYAIILLSIENKGPLEGGAGGTTG